MKKLIVLIVVLVTCSMVGVGLWFAFNAVSANSKTVSKDQGLAFWKIRSIDTMKYSRDRAREKSSDPNFDKEISLQVKAISETGANFIAIGTPLDSEFLPFLKKWVREARENNLQIWFRGNWSNWEGWFGYEKKMTYREHLDRTKEFIIQNPDLFENGDIFDACPECENGAEGDPRRTGRVVEYQNFLVNQTNTNKEFFEKINKEVITNFHSMNLDVAKIVMDNPTLEKLERTIVIDHYEKDPENLVRSLVDLATQRDAQIVLGEFGSPIESIHGAFDQTQQSIWLDKVLSQLIKTQKVIGLNYWVNIGGSTELWKNNLEPKAAATTLNGFYQPKQVYGVVKDSSGKLLDKVQIESGENSSVSNKGEFHLLKIKSQTLVFSKQGYETKKVSFTLETDVELNIQLERED